MPRRRHAAPPTCRTCGPAARHMSDAEAPRT
jgi:hypothetical protein